MITIILILIPPTDIFIVKPIHHTFECPLLLEQLLLLLQQYLSEISTSMLIIILLILLPCMTSYPIQLADLRLLLIYLWLDLLVIAAGSLLQCFELSVACITQMSIVGISIVTVTITLVINIPIQTVIVIFIVVSIILLLITPLPRLLLLILLPYYSLF